MSKFNFHQAVTEINKNGFVLHRLTQHITGRDKAGVPIYEWDCEVCNEEGVNLTEHGTLPLDALIASINAIRSRSRSRSKTIARI